MRAIQASPLLAGRLAQLEDHGERGHAAEAAFGLGGPEAYGRKGAFNGIGGANVHWKQHAATVAPPLRWDRCHAPATSAPRCQRHAKPGDEPRRAARPIHR